MGHRAHEVLDVVLQLADVAHMAVLHQIIQGVERLFDRRCRVETVQLIEIDMIDLQPLEALLDRIHDMPARCTAGLANDAYANSVREPSPAGQRSLNITLNTKV